MRTFCLCKVGFQYTDRDTGDMYKHSPKKAIHMSSSALEGSPMPSYQPWTSSFPNWKTLPHPAKLSDPQVVGLPKRVEEDNNSPGCFLFEQVIQHLRISGVQERNCLRPDSPLDTALSLTQREFPVTTGLLEEF